MRYQSLSILAMIAVAACAPKEPVLEGVRMDPRDVTGALAQGQAPDSLAGAGIGQLDTAPHAVALSLPAQVANAEWPQRAGNAPHTAPHAALGAQIAPLWQANLGAANGRKARITASPVVAGGRVFAMDAGARVSAVSTGGGVLWSADLTPAGEPAGEVSGGGLAAANGVLYVTTGYAELVALEAATGKVLWRQGFDTVPAGAPTVSGDLIYLGARDGAGYAIRASDGKIQWHVAGTPSKTAVAGGVSPAVDGRMVVFPFQTGDLRAMLKDGGFDLWSARVAGTRLGRAHAAIRDVTGDPVISGGRVYAGTSSGRIAAFDAGSGEQIWSASEGAMGSLAQAGAALFAISDENRLIRLDAATGEVVWAADMPYYLPEKKDKKRRDIRAHYGPVLAGGRLYVASSDAVLRVFDPVSGVLERSVSLPSGAASAPVVAGRVLYVTTQDGVLRAYR